MVEAWAWVAADLSAENSLRSQDSPVRRYHPAIGVPLVQPTGRHVKQDIDGDVQLRIGGEFHQFVEVLEVERVRLAM